MSSSLDFSGRRVLVTGGSKGIGLAIAKKCAELNAEVFILGRDEQALKEVTTKFPSIKALRADLSNWDETRKTVESILPIHHLANNAGNTIPMPFLEVDLKNIDSQFDVNFKAALNVGQVVAKGMIAHGIKNGTIVNISSITPSTPGSNLSVVFSAKEALSMMTRSMAAELAPHGIRVNGIRPGIINTLVWEDIDSGAQEKYLERTLSHKLIEPVEIANAFVFLSSQLSASVSGTDLTVDDGFTIL